MRLFLVTFLLTFLVTSCAPTAQFIEYDVYSNHPFIYGEDGLNEMPPQLSEGESWVYYIGNVRRTYRPRKKFGYEAIVAVIDRNGYQHYFSIVGKNDIRNGSRCYLMHEMCDGKIDKYLIVEQKRYETR